MSLHYSSSHYIRFKYVQRCRSSCPTTLKTILSVISMSTSWWDNRRFSKIMLNIIFRLCTSVMAFLYFQLYYYSGTIHDSLKYKITCPTFRTFMKSLPVNSSVLSDSRPIPCSWLSTHAVMQNCHCLHICIFDYILIRTFHTEIFTVLYQVLEIEEGRLD